MSDIVGAVEARRSVLAPPRSDAIGRSARALARSINASLRCISGVLSCLFALRRSAVQAAPARWGTLPERTCNGRVDSVSPADLLLKKETLARVGGRRRQNHWLSTLAAAADLWHVAMTSLVGTMPAEVAHAPEMSAAESFSQSSTRVEKPKAAPPVGPAGLQLRSSDANPASAGTLRLVASTSATSAAPPRAENRLARASMQ